MTSLFSKIIAGELPGHFALKDDRCVVFMTIAPIRPGHALVVPREPINHWMDMPADLNAHVFEIGRRVALAQRVAFRSDRVGLVIAGFEVQHVHLHCIPAEEMSHLNFANQEQNVPAERLAADAARLAAQLRKDGVAGAVSSD